MEIYTITRVSATNHSVNEHNTTKLERTEQNRIDQRRLKPFYLALITGNINSGTNMS